MLAVGSILYLPLMVFAKLSLLLFYRKVRRSLLFSLCIWITITIIVAYTLAITFALIFACTPVQAMWDITVVGGECIDRGTLYMAAAATNAATNLILLLLPIPLLLELKSSIVQKLGVLCMCVLQRLKLLHKFKTRG